MPQAQTVADSPDADGNPLQQLLTGGLRTAHFWSRVAGVYGSYKLTQLRAGVHRALGHAKAERAMWEQTHEAAGAAVHAMCIDLRGFYLKAGQFLGSRPDFVPSAWCRQLAPLQDRVPPMPPAQARAAIAAELRRLGLEFESVFESLDLDPPLGSASLAQVHKAILRSPPPGRDPLASPAGAAAGIGASGGLAWRGGLVAAVKIQYPSAEAVMKADLANLRAAAAFLQRTELPFDLVSVVDELRAQIGLEFDFRREARVMEAVAGNLRRLRGRVEIPRPVPALVTDRLLIMSFLEGAPLNTLGGRLATLPAGRRAAASRRILARISEAYGRMMLETGLFQADAHPGNILVQPGGRIAILDHGQSKQLSETDRQGLARLVVALTAGPGGCADVAASAAAFTALGVRTQRGLPEVQAAIAADMFDSRGVLRPFTPDSNLRKDPVTAFPQSLFFVMRVTQLIRGIANGMGLLDFSSAAQWRPYAERCLRDAAKRAGKPGHGSHGP